MKIDFTKIKKRYIFLVVAITGYYIWTIPPAEVGEILRNSDIVAQEQFIYKWSDIDRERAIKGVYLSEIITAVDWDKVCIVGEYGALVRERVLSAGGGNFEILDYWGRISENEYFVVLINKNKVVSVMENNTSDFHYDMELSDRGCKGNKEMKVLLKSLE